MSLGFVATRRHRGIWLYFDGRGWVTSAVDAHVYQSRWAALKRALTVAGGRVRTAWV